MATNGSSAESKLPGLSQITIEGFKSIEKVTAEIRPLTILAGANSSGKSSLMQPLLLMKQTVDASFDQGPLRLRGPNAWFEDAHQFAHGSPMLGEQVDRISVSIGGSDDDAVGVRFGVLADDTEVLSVVATLGGREHRIEPGMAAAELRRALPPYLQIGIQAALRTGSIEVQPDGPFLQVVATTGGKSASALYPIWRPGTRVTPVLQGLWHVPGLRLPPREYQVANVERGMPGTFDYYMPSLLLQWQDGGDDRSRAVAQWLSALGLTGSVRAERYRGSGIEVQVGRTLDAYSIDTVNISDVGVGVSQVLPVVAALAGAAPGQTVYLEQPELHLHPRAQVALAGLLAEAAARGVRAIVETHSDLLLLGVQTLVAEGTLDSGDAILHWFERSDEGVTTIRSADLDEAGSFGDWPEDFGQVTMAAQRQYIEASDRRQTAQP